MLDTRRNVRQRLPDAIGDSNAASVPAAAVSTGMIHTTGAYEADTADAGPASDDSAAEVSAVAPPPVNVAPLAVDYDVVMAPAPTVPSKQVGGAKRSRISFQIPPSHSSIAAASGVPGASIDSGTSDTGSSAARPPASKRRKQAAGVVQSCIVETTVRVHRLGAGGAAGAESGTGSRQRLIAAALSALQAAHAEGGTGAGAMA